MTTRSRSPSQPRVRVPTRNCSTTGSASGAAPSGGLLADVNATLSQGEQQRGQALGEHGNLRLFEGHRHDLAAFRGLQVEDPLAGLADCSHDEAIGTVEAEYTTGQFDYLRSRPAGRCCAVSARPNLTAGVVACLRTCCSTLLAVSASAGAPPAEMRYRSDSNTLPAPIPFDRVLFA